MRRHRDNGRRSGVTGARPLCDRPGEIGTLIVGTETGIDHSKPVAVYIHVLLGLPENCRTFETKHACYGAMAGLTASFDWIAAGRSRGRKALVIASDIASYGLNTPGEPTQGASAVAMVIGTSPRLMVIDPERISDYTRQVMDFWRPLYSKYAFADGHYSITCYLNALESAWCDAANGDPAAIGSEALAACLYHVPFVKMAKKRISAILKRRKVHCLMQTAAPTANVLKRVIAKNQPRGSNSTPKSAIFTPNLCFYR